MAIHQGIESDINNFGSSFELDPMTQAELLQRTISREEGLLAMYARMPGLGIPSERFATLLEQHDSGMDIVEPRTGDLATHIPQEVHSGVSTTAAESATSECIAPVNEFGEPILDVDSYAKLFPYPEITGPHGRAQKKMSAMHAAILLHRESLAKTLEETRLTDKNSNDLSRLYVKEREVGNFANLLSIVVSELYMRPYQIPANMPPMISKVQRVIADAYNAQLFSVLHTPRQREYLATGLAWIALEATSEGYSSGELRTANKFNDKLAKARK